LKPKFKIWPPPGIQQLSAVYLLAVVLLVFGVWIPGTFLTVVTMRIVAVTYAVVGVLALALLVPLIAGEFDISIGSMMAFSVLLVSLLVRDTGWNAIICSILAVIICGVVGGVNGLIIVRFRVPSFIATLAMSEVLSAAGLYLSKNGEIVGVFSNRFLSFGQVNLLGVPVVVYYLAAIGLIVWYLLEWTKVGRQLRATGSNAEAARLSGVRTTRIVWGAFIASGTLAGIGGVIYAAQIGVYSNSFGMPLLFPAFAAVFLGATQFKARPNVWGTILAIYVLALGVQGLELATQAGSYWVTPLFSGLALVGAVSFAYRRVKASAPPPEEPATKGAGIPLQEVEARGPSVRTAMVLKDP
jgi:ribose transport system permease protein